MIVAVDPGKRHIGIACFLGTELVGAQHIKSKLEWPECVNDLAFQAFEFYKEFAKVRLETLVLEYPQIGRQWAKGDPNDLLDLAYTQGAITHVLLPRALEVIRPQTWKGTVDADIVLERIKNKLTDREKQPTVLRSNNHNALDAVGIGLWRCGRLHEGRF